MPVYPRPLIEPLIQRKIYFVGGGSNKEYWVTIAKDTQGKWVVVGSWGRINSVSQSKLYLETIDGQQARERANKLMASKLAKGYRNVNGARPPEFSPAEITTWRPGSKTAAPRPPAAPKPSTPRPARPMRPTVVVKPREPMPIVSIGDALFG